MAKNTDKIEVETGKRIKALLAEKNISQKDFMISAWKGRHAQGSVSNMLNGNAHISILDLVEAAKFLEVSCDYLLGLTDDKNPVSTPDLEQYPITEQEFCKVLVDALHGNFPWRLTQIEVQEMWYEKPEYGDGFEGRMEKALYPAIYFSESGFNPDPDYYADYYYEKGYPFYHLEHTNFSAKQINAFLRDASRLYKVEEAATITRGEFEELIEKKISRIIESPF